MDALILDAGGLNAVYSRQAWCTRYAYLFKSGKKRMIPHENHPFLNIICIYCAGFKTSVRAAFTLAVCSSICACVAFASPYTVFAVFNILSNCRILSTV